MNQIFLFVIFSGSAEPRTPTTPEKSKSQYAYEIAAIVLFLQLHYEVEISMIVDEDEALVVNQIAAFTILYQHDSTNLEYNLLD